MGLALICEECQCMDNIQIGNNWYLASSHFLCYWCQHQKFLELYNVTHYEPPIFSVKSFDKV